MQGMLMPFFAFLGIVLLLPLYFMAFWFFDELIRSEYTRHRQDWEQDGYPWGFTWRPPEHQPDTKPVVWPYRPIWRWNDRDSSGAENVYRCAFLWLFRTPAWMRQDRKALRLILWYRLAAFVFAAGGLATYPVAFVYVVIRSLVAAFS